MYLADALSCAHSSSIQPNDLFNTQLVVATFVIAQSTRQEFMHETCIDENPFEKLYV